MSNLYYRRDIHKTIEGLLYGLFVYQYLLDTNTFGLLIRCLVQDQLLSLKSKAPTLRIALYTVFAITFLAFLRHLYAPDRYAVIIDFVGNVSTPSRSKLLWLDLFIASLQVTEALIVFKFLKGNSPVRRTTIRRERSSQSTASLLRRSTPGGSSSDASSSTATAGRQSVTSIAQPTMAVSSASSSHPRNQTAAVDSRTTAVALHNGSTLSSRPLSPLFEYTPEEDTTTQRRLDGQDERTSEYYVDDEEVRFSVDDDRHHSESHQQHRSQPQQQRQQPREARTPNTSTSGTGDSNTPGSDSSSEESEEGEESLEDDYEEILEQETFVFQLSLQDLTSYLFSGEEAISLPRLPQPRAIGSTTTVSHAIRVQNLPV